MKHDWQYEVSFGYADSYVCSYCGTIKHSCIEEGWGVSRDYFTPDGNRISQVNNVEPACASKFGPLFAGVVR